MAAQPPAPERASVTSVPSQGTQPDPTATTGPDAAAGEVPDFPVEAGSGPEPEPEPEPASRRQPRTSSVGRIGGLPRWTLLAGAVGMLVVLVGLVTFVVLPAFRSHQALSEWSQTSVALPSKVGNLKRLKGTQINALVKTMAASGVPRGSIAVYGTLGKNAVILVAAKPEQALTDDDQVAQREAMERGFTSASKVSGFALKEQADAGPLGGYLGCGKATNSSVTICLATDSGSVVGTITGPTVKDPASLTRTARSAAVTRTP